MFFIINNSGPIIIFLIKDLSDLAEAHTWEQKVFPKPHLVV